MATKIIGFIRCTGFDHLVRFITDAPANKWGQRFVIYQDGFRVRGNYQNAGIPDTWLPIEQLSADRRISHGNKSEQSEYAACAAWSTSDECNISDRRPFAIDA